MVDMNAVAAAVSSLKTAGEIVQAMIGLRDASAFQAKAIELQRQILAAQQSAFAAHSDQFSLLQRVRDLEEEIRRVKAWETEKQRYEMIYLATGIIAYRIKPAMRGSEPIHEICANCYEHDRKSYLQKQPGAQRTVRVFCPSCQTSLSLQRGLARLIGDALCFPLLG